MYPQKLFFLNSDWLSFAFSSAMQYKLVTLLAPHGRVTVVGDDDQSIFGFNGSFAGNFDAYRRDFAASGLREV